MEKGKKKYLRIGKLRIRIDSIPERLATFASEKAAALGRGFPALMGRRIKLGSFNVSIGFIVVLVLVIIIVAAVLGNGEGFSSKSKANQPGDELGYIKVGARLTPDDSSQGDAIYYWNIIINNHKHETYEEWAACKHNKDDDPDNNDLIPPDSEKTGTLETVTIKEKFEEGAPTWLRSISAGDEGEILLHSGVPVKVNRSQGVFGQTASEKDAPAYIKLLYVGEEYERQEGVDVLNQATSLHLSPVPTADVWAIRMTQEGFEIDITKDALLGKTLAIAYMTIPTTTELGAESPNRGKFVIESYDFSEVVPMEEVGFEVTATSENEDLAAAANALIEKQREEGAVYTRKNGKVAIDLPPIPFEGGKALTLNITAKTKEGFVGVRPFTVVISASGGNVISIAAESGDQRYIETAADQFGVCIWNRSAATDSEFYDAALRTWVKKVDREVNGEMTTIYYKDDPNIDVVAVEHGDVVLFRVDVYNQCYNHITIPAITDWLSAGLKFDPFASIAHADPSQPAYNNNLWALEPAEEGQPDTLKYIGEPMKLPPWDGDPGRYPEFRLPLVLTVDVPEEQKIDYWLTNIAKISALQDLNGLDVEDADSTPGTDRDSAGLVPTMYYNDVEERPTGVVNSGDIEGHRKDEDGLLDYSQDEDDHDFAALLIVSATSPAEIKDGVLNGSDLPNLATGGDGSGSVVAPPSSSDDSGSSVAPKEEEPKGNFFSRLLDFFKRK